MKTRSSFTLLALFLLFALGVGWVFQLRLNSGDVYPTFSTFRADGSGLAAIYAALNRLPGVHASRWLRDTHELEARSSQTLIFAGMTASRWNAMSLEQAEWLAQSARSGARVVITFQSPWSRDDIFAPAIQPEQKSDDAKEKKPDEDPKKPEDAKQAEPAKQKAKESEKLDERPAPEKVFGVKAVPKLLADPAAPETKSKEEFTVPQSAPWQRLVTFALPAKTDWKIKATRGGSPLLIERDFGRGSIVLVADTYFLTNEAVSRHEATPFLAWLLGPSTEIIFDETHLGLEEDVGIAALARRYGLGSAMVLLLVLAGLFIWRRTAVFVPGNESENDAVLEVDHTAGLESLLRRALPREKLIETCLSEFKPAHSADRARVEKAVATADAYLVSKYNAAVHSLRLKP